MDILNNKILLYLDEEEAKDILREIGFFCREEMVKYPRLNKVRQALQGELDRRHALDAAIYH